jgi:hypothetical protein
MSAAERQRFEEALDYCSERMMRELGPSPFPARTVEEIEEAMKKPETRPEAERRTDYFSRCFVDRFLGRFCAENPKASQCPSQ